MKKIAQRKEKKQPKIKVKMTGKGLTSYGGLLLVLNFMKKLQFRERIREGVKSDRAPNAKHQRTD